VQAEGDEDVGDGVADKEQIATHMITYGSLIQSSTITTIGEGANKCKWCGCKRCTFSFSFFPSYLTTARESKAWGTPRF
jgi:hypothetical protein